MIEDLRQEVRALIARVQKGDRGPQGLPGPQGPKGEVPEADLERIDALEEAALLAPKFEIVSESPSNPDPNVVYLVFG